MLLQVDVESLIMNRITIDYFLVAQLLHEKNHDLLSKYLSSYSTDRLKLLFQGLVATGLITNRNFDGEHDFEKITVNPSFMKVLAQGDFFDEFIQAFPVSITRPDGTRDYLRTDTNRSRKMYQKVTGKKHFMHNHILECLRYEIALRKKEGKMEYMKRLPKWIASEEWKVYEQMMKDETFESLTNGGVTEYGTTLE